MPVSREECKLIIVVATRRTAAAHEPHQWKSHWHQTVPISLPNKIGNWISKWSQYGNEKYEQHCKKIRGEK